MSLTSLKLFEIAVSTLDSRQKSSSAKVKINKNSIFEALNWQNDSHRNTKLTATLKKLQHESIFSFSVQDSNGKQVDISITPISKAINPYDSEYASLTFTSEVLPYLIDLRKNFTRYQLNDILHLNSKYAIAIYRWLMMNYRQYEAYANTNQRTSEQLEQYRNPTINLVELRHLTGTAKKYKDIRDLLKRVVKPAAEEISENTGYRVIFERHRIGRKVTGIKFFVSEKQPQILDSTTPRDDAKVINQQLVNSDLKAFLDDRIVKMMVGANLVDLVKSISDADYRSEILTKLVPDYQTFEQQYGETALHNHLNYVGKYLPDKVDNLTDYLLKALQNYETKKKQDARKPKPQQRGKRSSIKEELLEWAKHPEKIRDDKPTSEAIAEVKAMIAEFDRNYGDQKNKH